MAEVGAILRKQQEKLGELLCKKTHFLSAEIQGLLNVHRRLQMTPKSNDSNAGISDRFISDIYFQIKLQCHLRSSNLMVIIF